MMTITAATIANAPSSTPIVLSTLALIPVFPIALKPYVHAVRDSIRRLTAPATSTALST